MGAIPGLMKIWEWDADKPPDIQFFGNHVISFTDGRVIAPEIGQELPRKIYNLINCLYSTRQVVADKGR